MSEYVHVNLTVKQAARLHDEVRALRNAGRGGDTELHRIEQEVERAIQRGDGKAEASEPEFGVCPECGGTEFKFYEKTEAVWYVDIQEHGIRLDYSGEHTDGDGMPEEGPMIQCRRCTKEVPIPDGMLVAWNEDPEPDEERPRCLECAQKLGDYHRSSCGKRTLEAYSVVMDDCVEDDE